MHLDASVDQYFETFELELRKSIHISEEYAESVTQAREAQQKALATWATSRATENLRTAKGLAVFVVKNWSWRTDSLVQVVRFLNSA